MYSVKLADGTELTNLELNGNNFIAEVLDKNVFQGNLDRVTITDGEEMSGKELTKKCNFHLSAKPKPSY